MCKELCRSRIVLRDGLFLVICYMLYVTCYMLHVVGNFDMCLTERAILTFFF